MVALLAGLVRPSGAFLPVVGIAFLGGMVGAFFDSFLGATVQAIYLCPHCEKETEKHPLHTCGTRTERVRGLSWLNNDMVNTFCAAAGSIIGLIL